MPTTAETLFRIAECLLVPLYSAATAAGTTTTLVDGTLTEPDGMYDGGTLWFLSGALSGKTTVITSWDLPTHTFTFADQGIAPGIGAQYAVLDARYPRSLLLGSLNAALKALGPFDTHNDTLVVTSPTARTYSLPAGVANVKRVQYSNESSGATFTYGPIDHWWKEVEGVLYLSARHLPSLGQHIRLWHPATPTPTVFNDTDWVTAATHLDRIAWIAAWNALRARNARADTVDQPTKELEQKAQAMVQLMAREHPVQLMDRDSTWIDL